MAVESRWPIASSARGGRGDDSGQRLRAPGSAELAREVGDDQHDDADQQTPGRAAGRAGPVRDLVGGGRDQRRQRRLVRVAPLRMVAPRR